ncbi:MAG: outer membrane beta-barrel protein [Bacteroidota bacterium]
MTNRILPLLAMFMSFSYATTVLAQDADSLEIANRGTLTISGSGDIYYRYDMIGKTKGNNYTSFTNSHNAFELGMASAKLEYNYRGLGICADLGFGKRAMEFSYNDVPMVAAIKQLYMFYQPKDFIKITAGSWGTHVGYELLDPHLNANYSMSYMFTNGPFFHTGLKFEFFKGPHTFMVGVANPTDFKYSTGALDNKVGLAQYSVVVNPHLSIYLNYVGGQALDTTLSNQIDLVLSSAVTDEISLGFNGTVNLVSDLPLKRASVTRNVWHGQAIYFKYMPKPWAGLAVRLEHFGDPDQLKVLSSAIAGGSVFEATLSANFKVYGLTVIPEFRFDGSNQKIFTDKDGAGTNFNASFVVAAIYNFSVQPKLR